MVSRKAANHFVNYSFLLNFAAKQNPPGISTGRALCAAYLLLCIPFENCPVYLSKDSPGQALYFEP